MAIDPMTTPHEHYVSTVLHAMPRQELINLRRAVKHAVHKGYETHVFTIRTCDGDLVQMQERIDPLLLLIQKAMDGEKR